MEKLGKRIRILRTIKRMSSKELAQRINIHPTLLSKIENGHRHINVILLERIAEALDTTPSEVLKGVQHVRKY